MAQETQKKEREAAAAATGSTASAASTTPATTAPQTYTPDYAAGLIAPAAPVSKLVFLYGRKSSEYLYNFTF